jgi:hypothetical protein
VFVQISAFVLEGLIEDLHYDCWILHCTLLLILLNPVMTSEAMAAVPHICKRYGHVANYVAVHSQQ